MTQFNNQVVLVTGGGAGIGLSAASTFASKGARVVITGRRLAALEQAARTASGIDYIVADVGNTSDASRTIEEVMRRYGRLDALVNNAGAGATFPCHRLTLRKLMKYSLSTSLAHHCWLLPHYLI